MTPIMNTKGVKGRHRLVHCNGLHKKAILGQRAISSMLE